MKFCTKCGAQIHDEAVVCVNCGCPVTSSSAAKKQSSNEGFDVAIKVLLILGTVVQGLYLIPLAWCLPITLSICRKLKNGEPISVGMKVCALLFVNTIAGILLLIKGDN